jgi:hypothetical protein
LLQGAAQPTAGAEDWLEGKSVAKAVVEEAARKDLFGSETGR